MPTGKSITFKEAYGREMPTMREMEEEIAAETTTVKKFYFYHPADRKARARDLLRHIAKHEMFKTEDGMADVALEQLWNCMSGNDEGR